MRIRVPSGKRALLFYATVMNMTYEAYATAVYSIFGNGSAIRNLMICILLAINGYAILKNFGMVKILAGYIAVFGGIFVLSSIFHKSTIIFVINNLADFIRYILLAFTLTVLPLRTLKKALKWSAYIILATGMLEPITHFVTSGRIGYMVYGMRMLTAAALIAYFCGEEHKPVHYAAWSLCTLMILLYGNRSAVLNSIICFACQWLLMGNKRWRVLRWIVAIVAAVILVLMLSSDFFIMISGILEKIGIEARTLRILSQGLESFIDNNGRSLIWKNCINAIAERPYIGYGIGGERSLDLLGIRYTLVHGKGTYAHNFILELIIDFGVIFGGILIIYMFTSCVKLLRRKDALHYRNLFAIALLSTIIKLSVSSSLWVDVSFYLMIGLAMNYFYRRKYRQRLYAAYIRRDLRME